MIHRQHAKTQRAPELNVSHHTRESIETALCSEIEALLSLPRGQVTPEVALQSIGFDSLRFVSLLVAIEQRFGLNLMKAGLDREALRSVSSLAAAIEKGLTDNPPRRETDPVEN